MRAYYIQLLKLLLFTVISLHGAEQSFNLQDAFFACLGGASTMRFMQLPKLASNQQTDSPSVFNDITTLDLSNGPTLNAVSIQTIAALFPNLEELTVDYEKANSQQETLLTRELAQDLVTSFPNLRSLTLVNIAMYWSEEDAEAILLSWQNANPHTRVLNLKIDKQQGIIPFFKNIFEHLSSSSYRRPYDK